MEEQTQPTQQTNLNWLDEELKELDETTKFKGEKLPALKLESGKVTTFEVVLDVPFGTWTGNQGGKDITKAIIPVIHKTEKKVLWLNKKNPIYRQMIEKIKAGQRQFRISASGAQADTQYQLVEEA